MWNVAVVSRYNNKIIGFEENISGRVIKFDNEAYAHRCAHELNTMTEQGSREYFSYVVTPDGKNVGDNCDIA